MDDKQMRGDSDFEDEQQEIEVTNEMLEAGVAEFYACDPSLIGTAETAVWAIFRAMTLASPRFRNGDR